MLNIERQDEARQQYLCQLQEAVYRSQAADKALGVGAGGLEIGVGARIGLELELELEKG